MATPLPRPEYPRPQFVRPRWLSLNGTWEFAYDDGNEGLGGMWFDGRPLGRSITVPFAYQTELSGINEKEVHEVVWYARSFAVPAEWDPAADILLHFGAVDYRASVWVNGQEVGHNQGGHVPFSFDISPYLRPGDNRLAVRAEDPQDPRQPRGKQSSSGLPAEVDYHCTTGIWQTVWLEPVPHLRIEEIVITPRAQAASLEFLILLHAPSLNWEVEIEVSSGGSPVVSKRQRTGRAAGRLNLAIPYPVFWSPDNPHLYDVRVRLYDGTTLVDEIASYAGLRDAGTQGGFFTLNGEPAYLAMALDQGYWPDGGLTAPSDEALRADVEWAKRFGFNGVRKHQKIEDPRWLYWCDRLGLMVWGEMANARAWSPKAEEWLLAEWERAVRRDYNHPCIVTWVPMNESWGVPELKQGHPGQFAYIERVVSVTRRIDPYRPVIDNDGWEHTDTTDIVAIHDYAASGDELRKGYLDMTEHGRLRDVVWANGIRTFARTATFRGQPIMLSEIGGFLVIPKDASAEGRDKLYDYYGTIRDEDELLGRYRDLMEGVGGLPFLAGFCYTQLTDVEHEMNGLMTYGRRPKVDPEAIAAIHRELLGAG